MEKNCIGAENKDEIRKLEVKLQLLEKDLNHIRGNMVTVATLNELQLEISKIESAIQEMQNNRKEDREAIKQMSSSVSDLNARLEEYIENTYEITANQKIYHDKQDEMNQAILSMKEEIQRNNVINQIREFSGKSRLHKAFVNAIIVTVILTLFSALMFYGWDGLTVKEIIEGVKELI